MSCVAWVALVLSELDCSDSRVMSQLKPLEKFLDRAWLLPMHIASGMNKDEQSFRNLSLSFRGAERQSPTVLQMALRFSRVMERQADTMAGNTEARLKKVIGQFNESPGLHVKHQIDSDKERTILNLLIGTTKESRDIMNNHLTFTKWKDSAFSTEQLRTTRWLLGARPKNTVENYQDMLTVTAQAQCMLMELHIKCFTNATRRMKASARNRARANAEEFDKLVDFACVFSYIRQCAKRATAKPDVDAKLLSAFLSKDYFQDIEAVIASRNPQFRVQSLVVWQDIVEPPALPTVLQGDESADLIAAQELASASKFNEVHIKLTADCLAMSRFNAEKAKLSSKRHVAKVLHEKNQLATGKKVVEDFMLSNCFMGLVGDMVVPAEVDKIIKATQVKQQVDRETVNVFCFSKLWLAQLTSETPRAIEESEFVVPMASGVSSAEGRRNYTDLQETAQWLGGLEIPKCILKDLLSVGPGSEMLLPTVVVNGMLYDGCVERACLDLGLPCVSQTDKQVYFNTALTITKNRILAMWKDGEGVMADKLPRYRAEIDEDTLPRPVQEPELKICTLLDGTLSFGTRAENAAAAEAGLADAAAPMPPSLDWDTAFAGEPREAAAWHAAYDGKVKGKFQWCPELTGYLVGDGDDITKFFLEASADYEITGLESNEAFLTYGAGTWLQDAKVDAYLEEYPQGKGENSQDSTVKKLREVIQKCESDGLVDIDLGGHTYTRPPSVVQGSATDQFDVAPKQGSKMLWRPNNVQLTGLRATNAASFFACHVLDSSPGLEKVWRMRVHKNEKALCSAKPLWFLAKKLKVPKDHVQRVV
ncbi:Uncharacterized protein SCF082_LOCUS41831 [Durusdinium trenchii]|uniref:Uncharacterized protein n=1 Tax=Durusdinium trenchii TaxID=1381693 RepID=A0ABP0QKX5_9DINO